MKEKNITGNSSWLLTNVTTQSRIIITIGVLIYLNTLNHGFVLDDQAVILQNRFVQEGVSGWDDILGTFYWKGYCDQNSGLFRPLSLLMYSLEWQILPGNPLIHHLVHIACYGILLWTLFGWLYELTGDKYPFIPFVAMLLFAVHPMHTEVVANLKSRDEIMALLFFSGSAWLLLQDIKMPSLNKKVSYTLLFFAALLSKEGSILFLPILFLMLWLLKDLSWKPSLQKLMPYAAVTLVWFVWRCMVIYLAEDKILAYTYEDNALVIAPDYLHRVCTAVAGVGKHIYLTLLPFEFSYDYSFPQISFVGPGDWTFILSLIIIGVCFYLAYRSYRTKPLITFSILFFFVTLALTSNVLMLIGSIFAERFLFTPSLGFCLLFAFILNDWFNKKNEVVNSTVLTIVVLIASFYTIIAVKRNKDWKSNLILFKKDLNAVPNSARAHFNYSAILLNEVIPYTKDDQLKNEYLSEVINELNTAVRLDPAYVSAYNNLGVAHYKTKKYAASADALKKAWALDSEDYSLLYGLGNAYFMMGLFDSSIVCHQKCLANQYIGKETYNFLGTAWFNKKDYKKAISYYQQGVQYDSLYTDLWTNYGNALGMDKQYDKAITAFDKSYQLNPSNRQPLYFKALTYYNMGDLQNARKWEEEFKKE
jgi:protein O-mannosyl-transferase